MDNRSKYKILTIDDEDYIRHSIKSYLEDYGFEVVEAANGREGIEVFDSEHPDLVLLDLRMPEMDGLQVLTSLNDKNCDIPFIVASGTGNIQSVVEALHLGARDYILKPIEDLNVLYHAVEKCLKELELKRENIRYQERLEELVRERTLELQQSEERYRAVFEYTGTAAVIVEADDTISMANSRFAELAAMDQADITGRKKWCDFVDPGDVETIRNRFTSCNALHEYTDHPLQYEIRFIDNNGDFKYVYASLGRIPGSDRSVISLLDVTEKKKAEQRWLSLEKQLRKSQKMEAIGTLAGGIAHDLNNILGPVLGYSDMIMRASKPGSDVFRHSEKIQKAALRAADLVSQVLSFNRREETARRRIKIHPVSREVIKLLKGSIPSTIRIVDKIDRNCGAVEADPTQIHQVIMNLCTNAYHAMEDTGGTLAVSLTQISLDSADMVEYPHLVGRHGPYLALEVSDTGCGMTDDVMERIFDPYFTTKEDGKGTGLGLATVYSIVKACNGDIAVKSSPGRGTVFTVLLPVVETQIKLESKDTYSAAFKVGSGQRLLVVDDDEDIVMMCKEGFETLGYEVDSFSSSNEAIAFFRKNYRDIDLVITDQTMPGKTGFDLARAMLSIKQDIPIILCSGYAGEIDQVKVKELGIRSFVMKPVTVLDLSRKIQKLLS